LNVVPVAHWRVCDGHITGKTVDTEQAAG